VESCETELIQKRRRVSSTFLGTIRQKKCATVGMAFALAVGCGGPAEQSSDRLTGTVAADGSSTVFPITEAIAEEFQKSQPGVRVTVGIAGTGGGFKRFTSGETDISNASRPIDPAEAAAAERNGLQYIELPVAFDGLSVLVNPNNNFVTSLTVEELKRIWQPESTVRRWSDVRREWPNREIHLYGPGTDSGTFDYFTEAIVGRAKASRPDFSASEDDNVLVQGISGDADSLGYFGFAYYAENRERLKLVGVDAGQGPVLPSAETILNGTYQPLSRPVFIYVSQRAASRPEVREFVRFYLTHAKSLVEQVGYVPLPDEVYNLALARFEQGRTGSVFGGKGPQVGGKLEDLLRAEQQ
jgi:phosphate transport system substrate-binding protein